MPSLLFLVYTGIPIAFYIDKKLFGNRFTFPDLAFARLCITRIDKIEHVFPILAIFCSCLLEQAVIGLQVYCKLYTLNI
jgi:hypothetical protein